MTSFEKLQRRIGGFPIEYPAAAMMGLAVAFATLALPDWRFEAAVNATGLPGIVSAAQPPLGTTARMLAALVLGALSALAVWFALRALDPKPQATDFPAFRAADLHPDAPRRRPINAGAEFGAPVDDLPSIEEQLGSRRPAIVVDPMPSFLSPDVKQPDGFIEVEPRFDVEKTSPDADAWPMADVPTRSQLSASAPSRKPIFALEPDEEATARIRPEPVSNPMPPVAREPIFAPEPVVQPEPVVDPEPVDGPEPVMQPAAAEDGEAEESVTELMARLESGLSERGGRPLPGSSGSAQEELRRALGELNRVSGRG